MKFLKGRYTNKDIQDGRWNKVKAFFLCFICLFCRMCTHALTWYNKIHSTKQNILHSYHVVSWARADVSPTCTSRRYYGSFFIYPFLQRCGKMVWKSQTIVWIV